MHSCVRLERRSNLPFLQIYVLQWSLGKCSYTDAFVKIAAQLGGGLVAFPLFHAISNSFKLPPFGGPEFAMAVGEDQPVEAFMSEFVGTLCLMFVIYALNWELNFGRFHYVIKQSLTAIAIRILIEMFPTSGPALNPMLATAWYVHYHDDDSKRMVLTDGSRH
jgi:glycerol uptake facilitator-like aquaporin